MGLREVTLIVSAEKTADTYLARSYPTDDRNRNGQIELYRVPVYNILIKGTSTSYRSETRIWTGLRFMPYFNDPKDPDPHYSFTGWANSGLRSLAKKPATYNPNYTVANRFSPQKGAFRMRDSFLIHAGPMKLAEYGWGSAGCVEIIGTFDDFKEHIQQLSGSTQAKANDAIQELVSANKLFVQVDYALPPKIQNEYVAEAIMF